MSEGKRHQRGRRAQAIRIVEQLLVRQVCAPDELSLSRLFHRGLCQPDTDLCLVVDVVALFYERARSRSEEGVGCHRIEDLLIEPFRHCLRCRQGTVDAGLLDKGS